MAIETKKYLDLAGLTHFWDNIKDYIDNKSISAEALERLIGNVAGDDALSARQITEDVLIKALIPEDAKESLDTLEEIAKWIQNHPDDVEAMSGNIAKIAEEVELDSKTLEYDDVYENTKTVRGDIVGAKSKIEKIAEEVELNPDTHEYTGVYAATNSVYSDLVAARGEIGGLKNNITGIKGLSYSDIIAALEAQPNYLKFTAEEDNSTISLSTENTGTKPDIKYSLNGGDWTQWDYSAITLNTGDTVRMKGNNVNGFNTYDDYDYGYFNKFKMTGKIGASGNIMSLLYEDDFEGKLTIPCVYCCCGMFYDCTSLTTVPELPATTLTDGCYRSMFEGCTSLTTAPELPATTLAELCYNGMFRHCESLTTVPKILPAMTLANYCYSGMFTGCTSLTTAPELPATTMAEQCYSGMFIECTSLVTAPELPATTLASNCYYEMFYKCTALTAAPELPATTLASGCYTSMFDSCTALTAAPELPATTLANYCYYEMFYKCTSLVTAPKILPATALANWHNCYDSMFRDCTSLTTAPELPATTLVNKCYYQMFRNCKSLTTAPELPATTLDINCYESMFYGCVNLNYIKMLATDISASNCLRWWVIDVASTGTFIKHPNMTTLPTGSSGIPSGWTVQDAA